MMAEEKKRQTWGGVKECMTQRTKKIVQNKLILLFILGLLIGLAFKTQSVKYFSVGFDDYKLKDNEKYLNFLEDPSVEAPTVNNVGNN